MTEYLFITDTPQKFFKDNKSLKSIKFFSQGCTVEKFYTYKDDDRLYVTKNKFLNEQKIEKISGGIYKVNSYILFNTDLEKGHPIDVVRNIVNISNEEGKIFKCYIYFHNKIINKKTPTIVENSNIFTTMNSNFIYKDLTDNFKE